MVRKRTSGAREAEFWRLRSLFGTKRAESPRWEACLLRALFQVVAQLLGARGVPQLAQRLRLDLADPLPGHAEPLPDLFQRALVAVDQPEPQLQHAPLARR